jgi:predicted ABC-type ATPase
VPEVEVRRRYRRGAANFSNLYMKLATKWVVYDHSGEEPVLIAAGGGSAAPTVSIGSSWRDFLEIGRER